MTGAIKAIQIGLVSLLLVLCCCTGTAYARGGCFGAGTPILTPDGYKPIEQIAITDQLVGLDVSNGQTEIETIGDIQIAQTSDYYLINDATQVTGSHPFYVQTTQGLELVQVHNLKIGDHLIGENNASVEISSIQHIQAPLKIYNLVEITPSHNFYADGILVHNKGGGGGVAGSGGAYGKANGAVGLDDKNLPRLILSLFLLIAGLIPFAFLREIYNSIRFRNKTFTDDAELIEFTKSINEKFKNVYSVRYTEDNEPWIKIRPSQEVAETTYQDFIDKAELIDLVSQVFVQYQQDWTKKKFDEMADYVDQPFYDMQRTIFQDAFGNNFDIVYQPTLQTVVPLSRSQQEDSYIFKLQINAELINFALSSQGYVLSGAAYSRSFTEYWKIKIDSAKQCSLMDIEKLYDFSKVHD
ncbi:Hint domain-containing protein [Leptothoe sp. LEGE 181152]|nr:Hint domain-containing protein [Leptothoe sp. LEGE 181152]